MSKTAATVLILIASVAHTAAHGIPAEAVQSLGFDQEEDCDPAQGCCDYTQGVEVDFDDNHSYILSDVDARTSFATVYYMWVNLQLLCDGGGDVFQGLEFENDAKLDGIHSVKGKRRGRSDGSCSGKNCNRKIFVSEPDRKSSAGVCDKTLLTTLKEVNAEYFADLTAVVVSLRSDDVSFSALPPVSVPSAAPVVSPPEDDCRFLKRLITRAISHVSSLSRPSILDKTVTVNAVCPAPPTTLETSAPTATPLSWMQIGDDVDGENYGDDLGRAVSLSGDGNRLVAGGNVLRLFDDINGEWTEDSFNFFSFVEVWVHSVAMTSDGNIFIFGDSLAGADPSTGAVTVFRKVSTWSQQGSTLVNDEERGHFGESVAITDDGLTVAAGAVMGDYVRIFRWNDSNNIYDTVHTFRGPADSYFGSAIAMASDGSRLVVGASDTTLDSLSYVGKVHIYSLNDFSVIAVKSGKAEMDFFGNTVAISSDGTTLAVGAGYNDYGGYVTIYKYQNNIYEQIGSKIYAYQPAVALSDNGNRLTVGSPYYIDMNGNQRGNTFVYKVNDDSTLLIGELLGEAGGDESGYAVALSGDGDRVAIGAPHHGENFNYNGHLRVYESSN